MTHGEIDQDRARALLIAARSGDRTALGVLLDEYRDQLRDQSARELRNRFAGRLDASDVVQQTCMSALRHFSDFQGNDPAEFDAWLRQVHRRNLIDEVRKHSGRAKRDATREVAGNDPEGAPSKLLAQQSTPSRAAIRADEAVELERAIAKLPPAQAQVVRMKHLQGRKLSEIAQAIGRSDEAVAGLLRRGLRQLRSQLERQKDQ